MFLCHKYLYKDCQNASQDPFLTSGSFFVGSFCNGWQFSCFKRLAAESSFKKGKYFYTSVCVKISSLKTFMLFNQTERAPLFFNRVNIKLI